MYFSVVRGRLVLTWGIAKAALRLQKTIVSSRGLVCRHEITDAAVWVRFVCCGCQNGVKRGEAKDYGLNA